METIEETSPPQISDIARNEEEGNPAKPSWAAHVLIWLFLPTLKA
jgi:hypothetical protein